MGLTPSFPGSLADRLAAYDEHDWPEDATHENGNYHCRCYACEADFIGHKRRIVCRKCASSDEEK